MTFTWPARLSANTLYHDPVSTLDLMATFTSAAGDTVTTEDSVDLLPFLAQPSQDPPHEFLYWRSGPTRAIRSGRYELIELERTELRASDLDLAQTLRPPSSGFFPTDAPLGKLTLLSDMVQDPGETRNVARDHPDLVQRLKQQLDRWKGGMAEPILPPIRSTVAQVDGEWVQLLF